MTATDSQIAMWRGAIALAWTNDSMDAEEKQQLLAYFKSNEYLSDAQRTQLIADLDKPVALKDVWGAITDPEDRAHLINIAPTLFAHKGKPTPEEKALYDQLLADELATIDSPGLQREIEEIKSKIPAGQAAIREEYKHDFDNFRRVGRLFYYFDKMFIGHAL